MKPIVALITGTSLVIASLAIVGCSDDEALEDAKKWYRPWFSENGLEESPASFAQLSSELEGESLDDIEPLELEGDEEGILLPELEVSAGGDEPAPEDGRVVTIKVKRGENLRLYSEWSAISVDDLKEQNGIQKKHGLKIGQAFEIRLDPKGYRAFTEARATHFEDQEKRFFAKFVVTRLAPYTIKRGDNVWKIARKYDRVPVWVLEKFNSNLNMGKLKVGEVILVPILAEQGETDGSDAAGLWAKNDAVPEQPVAAPQVEPRRPKARERRTTRPQPTGGLVVTVAKGESLGHFASWAGLPLKAVIAANPGINPNVIVPGQKIAVPVPERKLADFYKKHRKYSGNGAPADIAPIREPQAVASAPAPPTRVEPAPVKAKKAPKRLVQHRVARGETAWVIANRRYKIGLNALRTANPEKDLTRLRVGDVLRIPTKAVRPGGGAPRRAP